MNVEQQQLERKEENEQFKRWWNKAEKKPGEANDWGLETASS